MISLGSRLIACCRLAPALDRPMWRHNYVIDRNEYLIFTLLESISPWVYSLQFLFKSTNNSWRYERKCEWVFFSEHSVYKIYRKPPDHRRSNALLVICRISNVHISAISHPIHFMFGSIGFSESVDQMTLFPVWSNPNEDYGHDITRYRQEPSDVVFCQITLVFNSKSNFTSFQVLWSFSL